MEGTCFNNSHMLTLCTYLHSLQASLRPRVDRLDKKKEKRTSM